VTAPRLPQVEALVERLADSISSQDPQSDAAWLVGGVATAGKSTTLRMLGDALRDRGEIAVLCAPPAHALDAGPMALAELAAGLKDADCVNGQTEILRDGTVPLAEKIKRVREWVIASRESIVLLLDEPSAWPDRFEQTQHFADHARLVVAELVRDIPCRRVLTGDAPEGMGFLDRETVGESSEPRAFLTDPHGWGELAQAADDLQVSAGERLRELSPLQLRLLVALVDVTSIDEVRTVLALPARSRRALSRRLLEALTEAGKYDDLLRAWRRLAHIRRPFAEELLGVIAGRLSKRSETLLRNCLLYEVDGAFLMHETLRRDAAAIPRKPKDDYREYRRLSEYYRDLRDEAEQRDRGEALPTALDGFYYAARTGDPKLLDRDPYFADQLDMLGKTLSYELHRYGQAAEVFERALQLDDGDDYAHHYLAYNLDRLGKDPERVERHYRGAIELNRTHPWWRARLIQFLLTRGRTAAARDEWDRALDELGGGDRTGNITFYETLHGWVADMALRRGQLSFADAVLGEVPANVRTESAQITALIRRLRALELAQADGAYVPSQFLVTGWWKKGPFLLGRRIGDPRDVPLRRWLAGRIEHIDEHEIELRVRDVDLASQADPPVASMSMSIAAFDHLSRDEPAAELQPGRFIEVGLYSDEAGDRVQRLLRVHAEREWSDDTLPQQTGAEDRYLRSYGTG
jgi:hypothetical protein